MVPSFVRIGWVVMPEDLLERVEMLEHQTRDRGVERTVAERHRLGAGACVSGTAAAFPCDRDLSRLQECIPHARP